MAGRKTLVITDRQFAVLTLLWEHGPLTVREVQARLPGAAAAPYTTVLALLQHMERSGLLTHDAEKQGHRYRPLVGRREATGSLLADFLGRFFRGSPERLVLSLLDTEHLSADDLRDIEAKLADAPPAGAKPPSRPKRPRRKS
jgi:predicted transcriptional regulator